VAAISAEVFECREERDDPVVRVPDHQSWMLLAVAGRIRESGPVYAVRYELHAFAVRNCAWEDTPVGRRSDDIVVTLFDDSKTAKVVWTNTDFAGDYTPEVEVEELELVGGELSEKQLSKNEARPVP
jgi:hypothetical protein